MEKLNSFSFLFTFGSGTLMLLTYWITKSQGQLAFRLNKTGVELVINGNRTPTPLEAKQDDGYLPEEDSNRQ